MRLNLENNQNQKKLDAWLQQCEASKCEALSFQTKQHNTTTTKSYLGGK
jgi:hypothetical protein